MSHVDLAKVPEKTARVPNLGGIERRRGEEIFKSGELGSAGPQVRQGCG